MNGVQSNQLIFTVRMHTGGLPVEICLSVKCALW